MSIVFLVTVFIVPSISVCVCVCVCVRVCTCMYLSVQGKSGREIVTVRLLVRGYKEIGYRQREIGTVIERERGRATSKQPEHVCTCT